MDLFIIDGGHRLTHHSGFQLILFSPESVASVLDHVHSYTNSI